MAKLRPWSSSGQHGSDLWLAVSCLHRQMGIPTALLGSVKVFDTFMLYQSLMALSWCLQHLLLGLGSQFEPLFRCTCFHYGLLRGPWMMLYPCFQSCPWPFRLLLTGLLERVLSLVHHLALPGILISPAAVTVLYSDAAGLCSGHSTVFTVVTLDSQLIPSHGTALFLLSDFR